MGKGALLKCKITLKAPRPSHIREIDECNTLGDHLRRARQQQQHYQPFVAQKLNVNTLTITNWELNRNQPMGHHIPKIIEYLGYTPLFNLAGNTLSKKNRTTPIHKRIKL